MTTDVKSLPKRRRLADLYKVGKMVTVTDDEGNEVEVWIQKISPIEMRRALDAAHAARAKVAAARNAPDDDERRVSASIEAEWDGFIGPREQMIDFLAGAEIAKVRQTHEAELAAEDEWSKNDYYSGLRDAWQDGLQEKFNADPDDKEASHVFKELSRFMAEMDKRVEREVKAIRRGYNSDTDEELRRKVIDSLIESESDQAWIECFRKTQLYFAVRDPEDKTTFYFEEVDEIDVLDPRVTNQLFAEFDGLMVDPSEGKD